MSISQKLKIAVVLLAGLGVGGGLPAADSTSASWPRFHGPNGDNLSAETGLLKKWPEGGPKLVWTAQGIGHGFAGVTLANGQIYTAGNLDGKTVITALDIDGRIRWQVENGKAWTASRPGARGTPTIDGDRLYHENPHGDVICLRTRTGNKVWGLNILEEFGSRNITWALAESLLIDGAHVICLPCGPDASVVALEKMSGALAWKSPSAAGDLAGYASALLAEHQGLRMILTMTQKAVIGVNADGGDLLFRYPHKTRYNVNATTPIFHDGYLFVSSGYGTTGSVMLKIEVDGKRATVEKVWGSRELDNHHGGVILVDGYLYGAAHNFNGGRWICLDWKTGEMKYAEQGVGKGSATYAEGMLYTLSENRAVGLVRATPAGHEVISRFDTPEGPEGPTWAHPVVCGGRLYIRHSDKLYAYDVQAE